MATRIKKQTTVVKEVASPQTSGKNESSISQKVKLQNAVGITKKLAKKPTVKTIAVKKTVQLKAKAKTTKRNTLKINPKNLARVLLENGKTSLEGKKILLKNGTKEVVKRTRRKTQVPKIKKEVEDDPPPVLEPIFPQEENLEEKKTPKKRGRKPLKLPELIDIKTIKAEPLEELVGPSEDNEESSVEVSSPKLNRKPGRGRKPKVESNLEEVMSDLSFLIDSDQSKKDMEDSVCESNKSDVPKLKKLVRKQRLDLIKKGLTKKENIENTLSKLDPADAKVIDRLDLNVRKFKTNLPRIKRRHSIEKCPIGSLDSTSDGLMPQLSVFNQIPRSISPKISKRLKLGGKRASPYSTRSDSPARMLRNGKYRKFNLVLLDGLEKPKRRKRVHSDLSGSETASKLSGYESDSSFSDLASLHGSEKDSDFSKLGLKDTDDLLLEDSSNPDPKPHLTSKISSPVSTLEKPLIDTNSNVCEDMDLSSQNRLKVSPVLVEQPIIKVPEKGLLLDKMKQVFNDLTNDKAPPKCETSMFYGRATSSGEKNYDSQGRRCSVGTQEMSDAATSTGDLSMITQLSEEEQLRLLLEQTDSPVEEIDLRKADEFPIEDKEAEEQASFENIVQGCIDSIDHTSPESLELAHHAELVDEAPILEKQVNVQDDMIPVIDNMSAAEPPQNHEHLGPPLLESSVPILEPEVVKRSEIDDHHIGITVTEKDNVVSFHIERLTDDVEEQENFIEEGETVAQEQEKDEVSRDQKDEEAVAENMTEEVTEPKIQEDQMKDAAIEENITDEIGESEDTEKQPREDEIEPAEVKEPVLTNIPESELTNIPESELTSIPESEVTNIPESESMHDQNPDETAAEATVDNVETLPQLETTTFREEPLAPSHETVQEDQMEEKPTEKLCDNVSGDNLVDNKPEEAISSEKPEEEMVKSPENLMNETPEELQQKKHILKALGLKSLHGGAEEPPEPEEPELVQPRKKGKQQSTKGDGYTGTLKTVIKKINKKKGKHSLHKHKGKSDVSHFTGEDEYKIMKDTSSWKQGKESSDTAGAHRKSHYSNRSNMDGSSEHTSDGEQTSGSHDKNQPEKSLIVPEKASSFSIHPGRLCKDECSYCYGKFGLFDTPCHIAQMKSVERQNKILAGEPQLTRDSCLCDACYRHVDRKSNSPSYINKSLKRNSLVAPGPRQNHCHVLGCNNVSSNILRRKWIIKMRKSICQVINIDLDNPGLHSIPICDEHFGALEHLMICAMCKRRLARNHIHYLGPEVSELNEALQDEGIPLSLSDKPVVCKLCKCFASIILKDPEERMENSVNFFKEYKKRLLHFNDIVPMDSKDAEEPIVAPEKSDKIPEKKDAEHDKKRKRVRNSSNESSKDGQDEKEPEEPSESRTGKRVRSTDTNNSEVTSEEQDEYAGVDYNTLIPAIAMDCPSDGESKKEPKKFLRKMPRLESPGNEIEITKTFKTSSDKNRSNDLAAQKLVQNPSISLKPNYRVMSGGEVWQDEPPSKLMSNPALSVRQLFPGEEELGLSGDVDFRNVLGRTPEGWEKCTATIQYDHETKLLWQELQKPYGSKSSFLRHLVLLEKYFRNGDLILSSSASHHAVNYRESVQNRLRAYDNIPSNAVNVQPATMIQFNKIQQRRNSDTSNGLPPVTISQVDAQSSKTPITLQQLNQPPLYPTSAILQNMSSKKSTLTPPGLISIGQRPSGPSTMRGQVSSQKIKFPITKNWRPTLIPIDPTKKQERKPGLVQVISGGNPYHITLEDYKKMCAIKRSFEAKQKKIHEQQQLAKQGQSITVGQKSVLKSFGPKKNIIIGKTSGGIMVESKPISLVPITTASATITSSESTETILEKLDKQVERLGRGQDPSSISAIALEKNPAIQIIPRIPKSLTVIPQTVRKTDTPSPALNISSKSGNTSENGGQP